MTGRVRAGVRVGAVVVPILVAASAGLAREVLANTSAALVLVLVIVAVAVAGDRLAGLLAAVSAAVSFDFFLTAPYLRLAIVSRDDVETAVLLVAIGLAISEIVAWGRRRAAQSDRRAGYLDGVARAAGLAAEGTPDVADTIAGMIREVLDLDACRFEPATGSVPSPEHPALHRDGTLTWAGQRVDVRREGLPVMDVIELPAGHGPGHGRFLLTASSEVRRPTREQLLVAVTLAEQLTEPGAAAPATGSSPDQVRS